MTKISLALILIAAVIQFSYFCEVKGMNLLRSKRQSNGFTWNDPNRDDDFYVFDAAESFEPQVQVPGMDTTQSPCEEACMTTHEYNPVCADDGTTYYNRQRFKCAVRCGKSVSMVHFGQC